MKARVTTEIAWADTNLFVALFADVAHPMHAPALNLFRRVAEGSLRLIVTPIVVAELVYVAEGVLGWTRRTAAERLAELLVADGLEVREQVALLRALELYGSHGRLDYADAYLAGSALASGPPVVASLDRDLDRVRGIRRLRA